MKKLTNKQGFTLIEVVLVLAIGGLIFLLAFIAFQQVSANRRDTQRRADAGRIIAELVNYKVDSGSSAVSSTINNGSKTPNTGICTVGGSNLAAAFTTQYLCKDGMFPSPDGNNYNTLVFNDTGIVAKDQIRIALTMSVFSVTAKDCSGNDLPNGGYRVDIGLEKGVACRDSR